MMQHLDIIEVEQKKIYQSRHVNLRVAQDDKDVLSPNFSNKYIGLSLYLFISFAVAVFFTILIEERFLSYRARFIDKLFSTDNRKNV